MEITSTALSFQVILGVLLVDILLSGDNAIVIALVCRSLPKSAQAKVMWIGILGAFLARLFMTSIAVFVMEWPLIKLIGGLLLLKISVDLVLDNAKLSRANGLPVEITPQSTTWAAARTIILADVVMSLDNVLALSAVTDNHLGMLVVGLVLSIPILMFGSIYISRALDRFPLLLWVGAAILGGVAGSMLIEDSLLDPYVPQDIPWLHFVASAVAAVGVIAVGYGVLRRRMRLQSKPTSPFN